jgi:hypothetical protein
MLPHTKRSRRFCLLVGNQKRHIGKSQLDELRSRARIEQINSQTFLLVEGEKELVHSDATLRAPKFWTDLGMLPKVFRFPISSCKRVTGESRSVGRRPQRDPSPYPAKPRVPVHHTKIVRGRKRAVVAGQGIAPPAES